MIDCCQMCDMGPKSGTSGDQEELQEVLSGSWQSTTPACKPMTHDKIYYFLPYWDDKPCLHVRSIWPDYRRRMYNSNIIGRISDKLVSREAQSLRKSVLPIFKEKEGNYMRVNESMNFSIR